MDHTLLSDKDIYCVAHFMMYEHLCDAELEAATHARRMLQRGDSQQLLTWFRIWRTITLMRQTPSALPH
jgi:hypothetical protein